MVFAMDEDLLRVLRESAVDAPNCFHLSTRLMPGKDQPPNEAAAWLGWAFGYDYVEGVETERRDEWGPWSPMMIVRTGAFPPPLSEIPDDVLDFWAGAASECGDVPIYERRLKTDPPPA
jgi:hypothetical protein